MLGTMLSPPNVLTTSSSPVHLILMSSAPLEQMTLSPLRVKVVLRFAKECCFGEPLENFVCLSSDLPTLENGCRVDGFPW